MTSVSAARSADVAVGVGVGLGPMTRVTNVTTVTNVTVAKMEFVIVFLSTASNKKPKGDKVTR